MHLPGEHCKNEYVHMGPIFSPRGRVETALEYRHCPKSSLMRTYKGIYLHSIDE